MRSGFTTGSCAAAASKAAAKMLFSGEVIDAITITTPSGDMFFADIVDIKRDDNKVTCAVIKDGGDDPDVTTGAHITSTVRIAEDEVTDSIVSITGGAGVGVVTKPGLEISVGEAAINTTPRKMITKEVLEICDEYKSKAHLNVEISVPGGELIAQNTFNPRLGIEGGISIIGTSGIVTPMSAQAIKDTIRVELNQRYALNEKNIVITPGNYGQDFLKNTYNYDVEKSVKCSNFIGETIDYVSEIGFDTMILIGHIGKLVKVAGGIMNTHSKEADCRMEILSSVAITKGMDVTGAKRILSCITTKDAIAVLKEYSILEVTMDEVLRRIIYYIKKRAKNDLDIECIIFENDEGILSKTKGADKWLTLLGQEAVV